MDIKTVDNKLIFDWLIFSGKPQKSLYLLTLGQRYEKK